MEEPDLSLFTVAEQRAWGALAAAASMYFKLPVVHPSDREEAVRDVHNLQNRLLARVAYDRNLRLPAMMRVRAAPPIPESDVPHVFVEKGAGAATTERMVS